MANFKWATHVLSFSNDYKKLQISDNAGTLVDEFSLDNGSDSVSLTVAGDDYVIVVAEDFTSPSHEIDVTAGDELSFPVAKRMDGIGIMDLRDTNRTTTFSGQYDLECTVFRLKYVAGPFPLKIEFPSGSSNCFTEV